MTDTSHLRPDGTVFPPVTPDPPLPPGYEDPLGDSQLEDLEHDELPETD